MKRVKIMLTAIGVFAVVGGALAFKAKTFGTDDYCIRTTTDASDVCTTFLEDREFISSGTTTQYKYRITTNTNNCNSGNVTCPNTGRSRT